VTTPGGGALLSRLLRGLRPRTPSTPGSLALARPAGWSRCARSADFFGGCAPGPHRRPARWRSHGRPA